MNKRLDGVEPPELPKPWEVVGLIARGGMGDIWHARRDDIGLDVAVKVIKARYRRNRDLIRRFRREAFAVNIVRDPGIVSVFDFGECNDGTPYYAMELVENGETFNDWVKTHDLAPDALRILRQVARTIARAHDFEIVHRDLKPDNIMVTRDEDVEGGERAKVLDFGIAKVGLTLEYDPSPPTVPQAPLVDRGDEETDPGTGETVAARESEELRDTVAVGPDLTVPMTKAPAGATPGGIGTPGYMAPEQRTHASTVTPKADVYSMGAIIFEAFEGKTPSPEEVKSGDFRFAPKAISSTLAAVVLTMLRHVPDERPSMREVARALEDELIATPPYQDAYEAWVDSSRPGIRGGVLMGPLLNAVSALRGRRYPSPDKVELQRWLGWIDSRDAPEDHRRFLQVATAAYALRERFARVVLTVISVVAVVAVLVAVYQYDLAKKNAEQLAAANEQVEKKGAIEAQLEVVKTRKSELEHDLNDKKVELAKTENQISEHSERAADAEKELAALNAAGQLTEQKQKELKATINRERRTMYSLQQKRNQLQTSVTTLQGDLATAKREIVTKNGEIAGLKTQIAESALATNELKKKNGALEANVADLGKEIQKLNAQITQLEAEKVTLTSERDAVRKELAAKTPDPGQQALPPQPSPGGG